VLAVGGFTVGVGLIAWFVIKLVMGIRVSAEEEVEGLDIGEHGLTAYPDFQLSASGFPGIGYPLIPMSEKKAEAVRKAILGEE